MDFSGCKMRVRGITKLEIKNILIKNLKPHPKNPRRHPDSAIERLAKSITEFGWTNPVLVSADGYVLAGHARLKAAQVAGLKEVPVIELPLSGAKAEAYLIADNRLNELTGWDDATLKDLLADLDTGELDLELTGFSVGELEKMMTEFHPDDEKDSNQDKAITCPKCGHEFEVKREGK